MEEELNLKDLLMALWRKKIIIIIVTIICFIVGIFVFRENKNESQIVVSKKDVKKIDMTNSYVKTDFMFGRGILEISDGNTTSYKLGIDESVIINLNSFSKSKTFLENVLNEIASKEKIEDVQENINIMANGTSDVITLLVAVKNQDEAIKITDKILEDIKDKVFELYKINEVKIIDGPVKLDKNEVKEIKEKIEETNSTIEDLIEPVEEQIPETSPKKKIILVTVLGFVVTCGAVVVIEIFSTSIKNEDSLEKATNTKVLVKIPNTNLDVSDKFDLLRVKLKENNILLITSPENFDGKSFVSENLAKSFARFGKKVLLTDTNTLLSDKNSQKELKESNIKNLTINLSKDNDIEETIKLNNSEIEEILKNLEKLYDVIIVDSGNVLDSANALTISSFVKAVVLVSSERKTKLQNIVKAKNNIQDIGGNVVGNVLNKTKKK